MADATDQDARNCTAISGEACTRSASSARIEHSDVFLLVHAPNLCPEERTTKRPHFKGLRTYEIS
jgi:hypothetical protein